MIDVLEAFSEKTGLTEAIEKAVVSGSDQADLFDLVVGIHRRNIEAAQSIMIDQLIKRRVAERLKGIEAEILQDVEALKTKIPNDPERLRVAAGLTIELARKRIEEQIRRECAVDIERIMKDFVY